MSDLGMTMKGDRLELTPRGLWVAKTVKQLETVCAKQIRSKPRAHKVLVDVSHMESVDTAGALLLEQTLDRFRKWGLEVEIVGDNKAFDFLSSLLQTYHGEERGHVRHGALADAFVHIGKASLEICRLLVELLSFLGHVCVVMGGMIIRPWRLRWVSVIAHMERIGVNAIPIVCSMVFSLGIVLSFQGADQLNRLGVEVYTINLVVISIVREVGVLITAILVAGRSGSAVTAELGTMKLNQEVDAILTFGMNPMEILVIPRVLALVLVMPLLTFVGDLAGIVGGGVFAIFKMGVSSELFINRTWEAITLWSFWIGIIKAPFFGFLIGVVSCFEGMQVQGGAESVGYRTTRSVVEGIFLVIMADALFSVFFVQLGV